MRRQQPECVDQLDASADVASDIIRACDLVVAACDLDIHATRRGSRRE
jgi:hypothetical protein